MQSILAVAVKISVRMLHANSDSIGHLTWGPRSGSDSATMRLSLELKSFNDHATAAATDAHGRWHVIKGPSFQSLLNTLPARALVNKRLQQVLFDTGKNPEVACPQGGKEWLLYSTKVPDIRSLGFERCIWHCEQFGLDSLQLPISPSSSLILSCPFQKV